MFEWNLPGYFQNVDETILFVYSDCEGFQMVYGGNPTLIQMRLRIVQIETIQPFVNN